MFCFNDIFNIPLIMGYLNVLIWDIEANILKITYY